MGVGQFLSGLFGFSALPKANLPTLATKSSGNTKNTKNTIQVVVKQNKSTNKGNNRSVITATQQPHVAISMQGSNNPLNGSHAPNEVVVHQAQSPHLVIPISSSRNNKSNQIIGGTRRNKRNRRNKTKRINQISKFNKFI